MPLHRSYMDKTWINSILTQLLLVMIKLKTCFFSCILMKYVLAIWQLPRNLSTGHAAARDGKKENGPSSKEFTPVKLAPKFVPKHSVARLLTSGIRKSFTSTSTMPIQMSLLARFTGMWM